MFNKILIANRGEIAVRVARSVKMAGCHAVAVYSDADRDSLHVLSADSSIHIGGSAASDSYLDSRKIIEAAQRSGATAIHPGYGFLSENADFADACDRAGITFIGPSREVIELMGNKRAAKIVVSKAGVPCIPGYEGEDQSNPTLLAEATRIGLPIMVKAAAGGGGRGMRLVSIAADLEAAFNSARSEALNAFGNDELILEKAITGGRHIEIQVLGDQAGHVLYLNERDCSLQRKHQKVIEEAPSPFVDAALRKAMGEAAVEVARSCHYVGAGTVEFLVADDRTFHFLEMNTRLQVEHPVTELTTGIDLVDWQLRIAAGESIDFTQDDVQIHGHAIEARLYAENPAADFMPQTGKIRQWYPSEEEGVRVDHGVYSGSEVSPYYDSMIAKIIVHGDDREQARQRMLRALSTSTLLGLSTNLAFLQQLINEVSFIEGRAKINTIDAALLEKTTAAFAPTSAEIALAAALLHRLRCPQLNLWQDWSNTATMPLLRTIEINEQNHGIVITMKDGGYSIQVQDATHEITVHHLSCDDEEDSGAHCSIDGVRQWLPFVFEDDRLYYQIGVRQTMATDVSYRPAGSADGTGSGIIKSMTEGLVVDVLVEEGDEVAFGQTLAVVEAMKMQHRHIADGAGRVVAVHVKHNQQIKKGQLLVELELASEESV